MKEKTLRTSVVSQLTIRSPSRVSEYGGRIKQKPVISAMTNTDCCNNLYFLQTPSCSFSHLVLMTYNARSKGQKAVHFSPTLNWLCQSQCPERLDSSIKGTINS